MDHPASDHREGAGQLGQRVERLGQGIAIEDREVGQLSRGEPQASVLRGFEKRLLSELGYAPLLEREALSGAPIEPTRRYVYEPDKGPVATSSATSSDFVVSGQTLLDLAADDFGRPETRDEARMLLRSLIGQRLHGQVLHTRAVLRELTDL